MKYETIPFVEGDAEFIEQKIDAVTNSIVPPEEGAEDEYLFFKIADDEGSIIAGCIVEIDSWKIACIDTLWVDENYRGQGLGSALIREAECAAKEKGCYAMTLGTFDFQARPLYEKHGFTVCGTIKNWPRGHENYLMMKRLDRPCEEYVPSKTCRYEIKPAAQIQALPHRRGRIWTQGGLLKLNFGDGCVIINGGEPCKKLA